MEEVDATPLAFGPSGAPIDHSHGPHFEDVNDDGITDRMAHFRIEETGIAFGDMEACVTGELLDGTPGAEQFPQLSSHGILNCNDSFGISKPATRDVNRTAHDARLSSYGLTRNAKIHEIKSKSLIRAKVRATLCGAIRLLYC